MKKEEKERIDQIEEKVDAIEERIKPKKAKTMGDPVTVIGEY